ncbi:MAG: peptidoglycan DD-metalloendopeptidase family protein [Rhodocyclaceae bacterium]|nr:peptidoglycan DD-metalloendopeptidase family protein [Rhodocyclaceae bacterium]
MHQARTRSLSWLLAALLTTLFAGCAGTPPSQRAPVEERTPVYKAGQSPVTETEGNVHVVKKGDTLSRIAAAHKLAVKDLVAWNDLPDPNKVEVDQRLRLSPPKAAPAQAATPAPLPAPAATPVAITAPVTQAAPVESRPLSPAPGQRASPTPTTPPPVVPATPAPVAQAVPTQPPAPPMAAGTIVKHEPLAGKQPYSEQALAKARASDGMPTPAANPPAVPQPAAGAAANAKPDVKPQVKPETKPEVKPAEATGEWAWPSAGKLARGFDGNANKGVDITGKVGDPVLAAGAGKVVYAGSGMRGYGKLVIVKHNAQFLTAYSDNGQILVKEGQTVTQGQKIAEMGKGEDGAGKMHFEVRRLGKPVDPQKFLPARE